MCIDDSFVTECGGLLGDEGCCPADGEGGGDGLGERPSSMRHDASGEESGQSRRQAQRGGWPSQAGSDERA
jgi:hypothetical protein